MGRIVKSRSKLFHALNSVGVIGVADPGGTTIDEICPNPTWLNNLDLNIEEIVEKRLECTHD
jgi:hypothetical protein